MPSLNLSIAATLPRRILKPAAAMGMTIMSILDLLMLAMGIALFGVAVAYVAACDRL